VIYEFPAPTLRNLTRGECTLMKRTTRLSAITLSLALACSLHTLAGAQSTGPDVIVGDLIDLDSYGSVGGISAFAVGTESCNIGTQNLLWQAQNSNHPVIGQNMFRVKDGRFEQIGMSWLKHGFTALTLSLCNTCNGQGGAVLGVGCSDPYVAFLNGDQGGLGPRHQVNATTGVFPFPPANAAISSTTISRRLQVHDTDLNPAQNAGALYVVDAQYVTADDAGAGNGANNASYRPINVNGANPTWSIGFSGATVREKAAIYYWKALDQSVQIKEIDVPGDGRIIVAFKAQNAGGGLWNYEYAIYNLTSHRGVREFTTPFPAGSTVSNFRFHDVDYHSGDGNVPGTNYDGTDWTPSTIGNLLAWTGPSSANANGNALRWGTCYSFGFTCTQAPSATFQVDLNLYRPGTPSVVSTTFDPVAQMNIVEGNLQYGNIGTTYENLKVRVTSANGTPIPGTTVHWSVTGGIAALSAPTSVSDANGEAQIGVTSTGANGGGIVVRAESGVTAVIFNLHARALRLNFSGASGFLITSLNAEFPNTPLLVHWDYPQTPPSVSTAWGDVYTSILNPVPTGIFDDGFGFFVNPPSTAKTNGAGSYSKLISGLGGLHQSGITIRAQAFTLYPTGPGSIVITNSPSVTL
jgi:hypothetical protein